MKPDHYEDGTALWEGYGGETKIYLCGCGELFVDKKELLDHVESETSKCSSQV